MMLNKRSEMGKSLLLTLLFVATGVSLCGAETEPTVERTATGESGSDEVPVSAGTADRSPGTGDALPGRTPGQIASWQLYVKVFEQNRAVQLDAVRTMQTYGKYEERYRLAEILLKQLFKVLGEAKVNITQWGFLPDDPFPSNQTIREGVSKALENTAMFGEMALRLPDIIHRIYDRQREWQELIRWGVWFCNHSQVFQLSQPSATLLNLMSQELRLVERDPTYINPFTDENIKIQEDEVSKRLEYKEKKKAEKKKKKEKKRGPRMSGGNRVEL